MDPTAARDAESAAATSRRRSPRAHPAPDTVLTVVMRDGDGRVVGRGRLHDLSAEGAGVLMPIRIAERIRALQQVEIALPLAPDGPAITLAGATRYVRWALPPGADGFGSPVLHLGIEFDAGTASLEAAADALDAWIAPRLAAGDAPGPLRPAQETAAR